MSKQIVEGMLRFHLANMESLRMDPDGDCPKCKPKLGTRICRRCGSDVRTTIDTACPASDKADRWTSG